MRSAVAARAEGLAPRALPSEPLRAFVKPQDDPYRCRPCEKQKTQDKSVAHVLVRPSSEPHIEVLCGGTPGDERDDGRAEEKDGRRLVSAPRQCRQPDERDRSDGVRDPGSIRGVVGTLGVVVAREELHACEGLRRARCVSEIGSRILEPEVREEERQSGEDEEEAREELDAPYRLVGRKVLVDKAR